MASRSSTLSPWVVRLLETVDVRDRQANDVARGLNLAQLNWRPSPENWSVGQCLQHLVNANDVYLPPITRALEGRSSRPVPEIAPGWFGRWFIRTAIEPSTRRRRNRAPRKIAPAPEVSADVLDRLVQSNVTLRDRIRRAAGYDVNRVRFQNPFVPVIFFTIGTGFEILVRHQHRHLLQAERIKQAFPK